MIKMLLKDIGNHFNPKPLLMTNYKGTLILHTSRLYI